MFRSEPLTRILALCLYFQVWPPEQNPGSVPEIQGLGPLTRILDLHLYVQV